MPEQPEPAADNMAEAGADPNDGQGRGDAASAAAPEPKPTRTRKPRQPVSDQARGRKLILPDDVADRLWLLARQRKKSVSAVATEILDRNLPRFTVTREG